MCPGFLCSPDKLYGTSPHTERGGSVPPYSSSLPFCKESMAGVLFSSVCVCVCVCFKSSELGASLVW